MRQFRKSRLLTTNPQQTTKSATLAAVRPYLKGLALILSLVAIGYGMRAAGLSDVLNTGWVDAEVKGQGIRGDAIFVGMATILAAVGFPRQVIAFMGGYAFGMLEGSALALLATTLGCILAFAYARIVGRSFVQRHFGKKVARFDNILADSPFLTTLLIRFLPVGSNVATNLIAGVSHVRVIPFVLGSAAGYLPQTAIFVLMGSGVQVDQTSKIGVGAALFVISGALGAYLYRNLRRGRDIQSATNEEL